VRFDSFFIRSTSLLAILFCCAFVSAADLPVPSVFPTIQSMVENIGADRLLWGTDMPFQNRHCTYRQSRDHIEKYCDFLSQDDLDLIMGGTASRILGLSKG